MIINVNREFQNKLFYDLLAVKSYSNLNIEKTRNDFIDLVGHKIRAATNGLIINDKQLVGK